MDFQPLAFEPLFFEKIWGGDALGRLLNKAIKPGSRVGESWELSEHKNGPSVVRTGAWKGRFLSEVIKAHPAEILGRRVADRYGRMPLLFKFIDANDRLSIQVHPDDAYASRRENDSGKTEAWVVVHAKPGARMICGLKKALTADGIRQALAENRLERDLNEFEVKTGDTVFVPAGTVHAIEAGTLIYEVQQVSDLTYRLYDWGRTGDDGKPRTLHVEPSLEVMKLDDTADHRTAPAPFPGKGHTREMLAACVYFALERVTVDKRFERNFQGSFEVLTVLSGQGRIHYGESRMELVPGETLLLPEALKRYRVESAGAPVTFLLTWVPESPAKLLAGLEAAGLSYGQIAKLGGLL